MDEQAGPAVLLGCLSGGGDGEAARAQYSIPGILHFLQHEWTRYEADRSQWDLERSELQAQIAFLQGERRGHDNLKKDLVRRIKMLEYALKQERSKHHKLKYGTELIQGDVRAPSYDSDEANEVDTHTPLNSSHQLSWKQGRQLLTQYLEEVGYTDAILDVKSQCVRALLGLSTEAEEMPQTRYHDIVVDRDHVVNSTQGGVARADSSHSAAILETFKLIEDAAANFSSEDEDNDSSGNGQNTSILDMVRRKQSPTPSSTTSDLSDDSDTEEALKGFDFLSSHDTDGGEDGSQWG